METSFEREKNELPDNGKKGDGKMVEVRGN